MKSLLLSLVFLPYLAFCQTPIISVSATQTTICQGNTVQLTATVSTNPNPLTTQALNPSANTSFNCDCPTGYVAVGYKGRRGQVLDQLTLACKKLNLDGSLDSTVVYTTSVGSSISGGAVGPFLFEGNTALVGVDLRITGNNYYRRSATQIIGYGQPISVIKAGSSNTNGRVSLTGIEGSYSSNDAGTISVPAGHVVTGMRVNTSTSADAGTFVGSVALRYVHISTLLPTINWSTGQTGSSINVSPSETTTYTATATNIYETSTPAPVTIAVNKIPAPSLLTQNGQSTATVDLNTGNVTLLASNCAGTVNWTGSNNTSGTGTTILVPTTQPGTFIYQASCQQGSCSRLSATATVKVEGRVTVLHRDVDNYADNNAIQPLLQIQNQGAGPLPLSRLTLRYYLTVENAATLGNLLMNYAQVGNQNVRLRYIPLSPAQQGATGYVEYSFTEGAGNLGAGANSGSIQTYFTKSDYSSLNELNDYSYNPVRDQLTGNLRITAYYDGILIAGEEPGSTTQIRAVRALTESKNGPSATQINTYLDVRNEGNVAINYSDLKVRYYFTSDGNERLQVEVDEGNVSTQLVKLGTPLAGADTYLELSFNQGGQLAPGTGTGTIRYRISKPDGGRFNQTNDYSYQEQPQDRSQNSRVVVYAGSDQRIWGQEPGAAGREAPVEPVTGLSVKVLGNPVIGSQINVEVSGVDAQTLRYELVDQQGRTVQNHQVEQADSLDRHTLIFGDRGVGVYLLRVSTSTQSKTVKVLRIE